MSKKLGQIAEERAKQYLQQQGLIWIQSNYTCKSGEIDLIMRDADTVVFVEVRYRKEWDFGASIETVILPKQHRLIKTAWHYLLEFDAVEKVNARFDVIGMGLDKICWIKNAFEVKY